jgi:hypothetical protein
MQAYPKKFCLLFGISCGLLHEKQPVSGVLPYAKEVTCEDKMKLYEEPIKGLLKTDGDAPVVFQLTDGETVHTAMHPNKGTDTHNRIDEGTNAKEHISIGKCDSLTETLNMGLE